jgi:SOS-response transcriptional repressor LexA
MRRRTPDPTPRMRECMRAIQRHFDREGRAPIGTEICAALGITGKGELQRLLAGLADRGFINRAKFQKGGIAIVKRIEA